MDKPAADFQRSRTDQRIVNAVLSIGLVASLVMAWPMMTNNLGPTYTLFFWAPFVGCYLLSRVYLFLRR